MGASVPIGDLMALMGAAEAAATIAQGESERAALRFEQRSLQRHAQNLDRAAADRIREGQRQASIAAGQARKVVGAQRARFAAGNVAVGSGSPLAVQQETAAIGAEEATAIRMNAFRQALGFGLEGQEARLRADLAGIQRRGVRRQSLATGGLQFARQVQRGVFLERELGGA